MDEVINEGYDNSNPYFIYQFHQRRWSDMKEEKIVMISYQKTESSSRIYRLQIISTRIKKT